MFQSLKLLFPSLGHPTQSFTKVERTSKENKSHWCDVFACYCNSALAITVKSDITALRKYLAWLTLLLHFSNCSPGAQWVPHHARNKYPDPLYQPGLVTIIKHHDHIHGDLQWAMRMLKLFLCKYMPIKNAVFTLPTLTSEMNLQRPSILEILTGIFIIIPMWLHNTAKTQTPS